MHEKDTANVIRTPSDIYDRVFFEKTVKSY